MLIFITWHLNAAFIVTFLLDITITSFVKTNKQKQPFGITTASAAYYSSRSEVHWL